MIITANNIGNISSGLSQQEGTINFIRSGKQNYCNESEVSSCPTEEPAVSTTLIPSLSSSDTGIVHCLLQF